MPYGTAIICRSGHVVNACVQSQREEHHAYCSKCGSDVITACPSCEASIPGARIVPRVDITPPRLKFAPKYCPQCGSPYPWTQQAIEAAVDLIIESNRSLEASRQKIEQTLVDVVRETPRTAVAVARIREWLADASAASAAAFERVLTNVVSDVVKRAIFGPAG